MPKPADYPLPWCDKLDTAYWRLNFELIRKWAGWADWQTGKPMSAIIPAIDALIEEMN